MSDEVYGWFTKTQWISIVGAVLLVLSWFLTSWLTSRRESQNKAAEIRLQYLIDAYGKLAHSSSRNMTDQDAFNFETAIEKIQLLGSPKEIELVHQLREEWQKPQPDGRPRASADPLLFELRRRLRDELDLPRVESPIVWIKPKGGAQ